MKKADKILKILQETLIEEKEDFLENAADGCLSDFQEGVLFGLKLAIIKAQKIVDKQNKA